MERVVEKMVGPVADEFNTVLKEMKLGRQRREALRDMAERVDVKTIIPMVFFIFPSIFPVLLGPIIIKVIETLM